MTDFSVPNLKQETLDVIIVIFVAAVVVAVYYYYYLATDVSKSKIHLSKNGLVNNNIFGSKNKNILMYTRIAFHLIQTRVKANVIDFTDYEFLPN